MPKKKAPAKKRIVKGKDYAVDKKQDGLRSAKRKGWRITNSNRIPTRKEIQDFYDGKRSDLYMESRPERSDSKLRAKKGERFDKGGEISSTDIKSLSDGYKEAILFTGYDDEEVELDQNYSISDFDSKSNAAIEKMAKQYIIDNKDAIEKSGLDYEQIGRDIWYTQAGHGVGFFDRELDKDVEDKLTKGAKKFGDLSHHVFAQDGEVYLEGMKFALGGAVKNRKVDKVKSLLIKNKVETDDVSPNFVNDFAHENGITDLTSQEVVEISDTYEYVKAKKFALGGKIDRTKSVKKTRVNRTKKAVAQDKNIKALHAGKRESESGQIYWEGRENRSDKNRTTKLEKGGSIDGSRDFHLNDYNKLIDSGEFEATKNGATWNIKEIDTDKVLGKYNKTKKSLSISGKKDLSNPLVVWLKDNSYLSSDERDLLGDDDNEENDEDKIEYIGSLIKKGNTSGYSPNWSLDIDFEGDIEDSDYEHIGDMVAKGFTSGEIVSGEEEKTGWWSIDISDDFEKGGAVSGLEKELRKLQKDLNSNRLMTYTEGDNSEEEKAREKERAVKLARFNEVLGLLREKDNKFSKGGKLKNYTSADLPKDGSQIEIHMPKMGDFPAGDITIKYNKDNFGFDLYGGERFLGGRVTEKQILDNLNNGLYEFKPKVKGGKFVITSKDQPNDLFVGQDKRKVSWVESWKKPILFSNETDAESFNEKHKLEGKVVPYSKPNENTNSEELFVAVGEKDGYWVILSRPTTKEQAEELSKSAMEGETPKVVTLDEAKAHKKIVGSEYLKVKDEFKNGGKLESVDSGTFNQNYRKWFPKMHELVITKHGKEGYISDIREGSDNEGETDMNSYAITEINKENPLERKEADVWDKRFMHRKDEMKPVDEFVKGGEVINFKKVKFNSHKNHNPNTDILEGHIDDDSFITYGIDVNGDKKGKEHMKYYKGSNYVVGSNAKSTSRHYEKDAIPAKYLSSWNELKKQYEEKYSKEEFKEGGEVGGRGFFGLEKGEELTELSKLKEGDIILSHSEQFNSDNTLKITGIRTYGTKTSYDVVYWNPETNKRIGDEEMSVSDVDLKMGMNKYYLPKSDKFEKGGEIKGELTLSEIENKLGKTFGFWSVPYSVEVDGRNYRKIPHSNIYRKV